MCGNKLLISPSDWVLIVVYYYITSIPPQAGWVGTGRLIPIILQLSHTYVFVKSTSLCKQVNRLRDQLCIDKVKYIYIHVYKID